MNERRKNEGVEGGIGGKVEASVPSNDIPDSDGQARKDMLERLSGFVICGSLCYYRINNHSKITN